MNTESYLIQLMRDVCEELGIPEEEGERCPILEALNQAHNRGAQGCAERFAQQGLLRGTPAQPNTSIGVFSPESSLETFSRR